MKRFKLLVAGLGLLALLSCNKPVDQDIGRGDFEVQKDFGFNKTVIYRRNKFLHKDSLLVLRHFWGNSYYFEDYGCDGTVDRIYLFKIGKSVYKHDPLSGKKVDGYEKLFDRADTLLRDYKHRLGIDISKEDRTLLDYLD